MRHVEIEINAGLYIATIKQGTEENNLLIVQSVEAASDTEIQSKLMGLGFHQQDVFDALAAAEGRSVNTPHPFFEEALEMAKNGEK